MNREEILRAIQDQFARREESDRITWRNAFSRTLTDLETRLKAVEEKLSPDKPECSCIIRYDNHHCPEHGWWAIHKKQKAEYDRLTRKIDRMAMEALNVREIPDPVPPLNVRVGRLLEYTMWTDPDGKWRYNPPNKFIPEGFEYPFVPDFPNDLTAAMGALEEYCENNACIYIIRRNRPGWYIITIDPTQPLTGNTWFKDGFLSTAICEAIVKHSEGK